MNEETLREILGVGLRCPHDTFVKGIQSGIIDFKLRGNAFWKMVPRLKLGSAILSKAQEAGIHITALITITIPLIAIPIIAYVVGDWWYLVGMAAVLVNIRAAKVITKVLYLLALVVAITAAISVGYGGAIAFCLFCALWSHITEIVTLAYDKNIARKVLIKSPEVYNATIERTWIITVLTNRGEVMLAKAKAEEYEGEGQETEQ